MPLVIPAVSATLSTSLAAQGFVGVQAPSLALSVAQGFVPWLQTRPVVTLDTGVIGSGTGLGTILLEPTLGATLLEGALLSTGFVGVKAPQLALGLSLGISQALTLATVQTTVVGVSNGAGIGTLTLLEPLTLSSTLTASLASLGFFGTRQPQLALALAQGLTQWLQTAVITTVDVGTPIPPFTSVTGSGTGFVL